jgi:hypothetical protein
MSALSSYRDLNFSLPHGEKEEKKKKGKERRAGQERDAPPSPRS